MLIRPMYVHFVNVLRNGTETRYLKRSRPIRSIRERDKKIQLALSIYTLAAIIAGMILVMLIFMWETGSDGPS